MLRVVLAAAGMVLLRNLSLNFGTNLDLKNLRGLGQTEGLCLDLTRMTTEESFRRSENRNNLRAAAVAGGGKALVALSPKAKPSAFLASISTFHARCFCFIFFILVCPTLITAPNNNNNNHNLLSLSQREWTTTRRSRLSSCTSAKETQIYQVFVYRPDLTRPSSHFLLASQFLVAR